jgi:head-tail adaptor
MRGPKTTCTLRKPIESRTSTGGSTNDWHPVTTFRGGLRQLSAAEIAAFGRETDVSTHKLLIGRHAVAESNYRELKNKNMIYCENRENPLAPETYDITGVIPYKRGRNKIAGWELTLRKVE